MRARAALLLAAGVAAGATLAGILFRGPAPPVRSDGSPIRVEVLNGSGVRRAGLRLAEQLRDRGFDVVHIGNAKRSDHETTKVLDRADVPEYAARVAEELDLLTVQTDPDEELLLEVTVIVGVDLAAEQEGPS